jgi:hypothetical protein
VAEVGSQIHFGPFEVGAYAAESAWVPDDFFFLVSPANCCCTFLQKPAVAAATAASCNVILNKVACEGIRKKLGREEYHHALWMHTLWRWRSHNLAADILKIMSFKVSESFCLLAAAAAREKEETMPAKHFCLYEKYTLGAQQLANQHNAIALSVSEWVFIHFSAQALLQLPTSYLYIRSYASALLQKHFSPAAFSPGANKSLSSFCHTSGGSFRKSLLLHQFAKFAFHCRVFLRYIFFYCSK